MIKIIDMGIVHGARAFYTGNRSVQELIEDGTISVVPDGDWIAFKRTEILSEVERRAALTMQEIRDFYTAHGVDPDAKSE